MPVCGSFLRYSVSVSADCVTLAVKDDAPLAESLVGGRYGHLTVFKPIENPGPIAIQQRGRAARSGFVKA